MEEVSRNTLEHYLYVPVHFRTVRFSEPRQVATNATKKKKIQKLRFPFRLFNIRYAQLSSFDFIYTSVDLEIRFVARHKEHV